MTARLAIKVDVDTLEGFRQGVPALIQALAEQGAFASFFLALGPDNSGRAIYRVFHQPGFLEKMRRTRAPAIYGYRTMLYGTLLPAPRIAPAAPELPARLLAAGHEVGLHGYDHVLWHDRLRRMSQGEVAGQIDQAQAVFAAMTGQRANAFAAPGWQTTWASREVLSSRGFVYASDTRGISPYWPRFGDKVSTLLEIPTTLPTLDELLGFEGCAAADFTRLALRRLSRANSTQVLTVHAELEGGPFLENFARLLKGCREQGVEFVRLGDYARELLAAPDLIPAAPVRYQRLPGRAGWVACQGDGAEGVA
jgi:peptidoglycan/xylan/chitin deacetylase (PgdA/CDA1 family)